VIAMKKITPCIVLVLFLTGSAAAASALSGPDAVFLEISKTYTLRPDGSQRMDYFHKVRLLTYFAVTRYLGETFIVADPQYQTLVIDKSETVMADGTVITSPPNAVNTVLPQAAADAPAYAGLRETVISHTGLERGCTVELRYHIETRADFLPWLEGDEVFGAAGPVEKYTVTILAPSGKPLKFDSYNGLPKPSVSRENGMCRLTWTMTDCPALVSEPGHAPFETFIPRLVFSTCPDWKTASLWLTREWAHKTCLSETTAQSLLTMDGSLEDKSEKSPAGGSLDSLHQILSIRRAVAEGTGDVHIDLKTAGFRFFPAETVFKNNGGSILDKTVLLHSMLKKRGFRSTPVLISKSGGSDSAAQCLSAYESAGVLVRLHGKKDILLYPAGAQPRNGWIEQAGKSILAFDDKGAEWMFIPGKKPQSHRLECRAELSMDSLFHLNGKARVETSGMFYEGFRCADPDNRKPFIKTILGRFWEGVEIDGFSVSEMTDTAAVFTADVRLQPKVQACDTSGLFLMTMLKPVLESLHVDASPAQRVTPLSLPHACREKLECVVSLPGNMDVLSHPKPFSVSNVVADARMASSDDGKTWTFSRECVFYKPVVSPAEYASFREAAVQTEGLMDRSWLVEKK
jgi:hypothetical protein